MRSIEHLFGVNAAGDGGMKVEESMGEGWEKMLKREKRERWRNGRRRKGVEYLRGIPQESPENFDDDSRTVLFLAERSAQRYDRFNSG